MSKNLEDLDIKDAQERTRIEPEFFQALLNKDFDGLQKFNVKGFFKILEREYDLDLKPLLAEYEAFLLKDEQKQKQKDEKPKMPPPRDPDSKIVTNVEQYGKESSTWWLWALIVLVAGAIIYLVWAYDLFKAFVNEPKDANASVVVQQSIDEAKNGVQDKVLENESADEALNANADDKDKENSTENSANSALNSGASGNLALNLNENSNANANSAVNSATNSGQSANSGANSTNAKPQTQPLNVLLNSSHTPKENEAVFSTDGKVWVGFIDLSTRTNSSMVTDSNFSVDLSKDQLLLIGGTALTLVNESGEVQNFPSGNSKRFLVKEGKIKAINDKEFRSYNGGKDW